MHTFEADNGNTVIHHNNDVHRASRVYVTALLQTGRVGGCAEATVEVTMGALLDFVAQAVSRAQISRLEQADAAEILGIPERAR